MKCKNPLAVVADALWWICVSRTVCVARLESIAVGDFQERPNKDWWSEKVEFNTLAEGERRENEDLETREYLKVNTPVLDECLKWILAQKWSIRLPSQRYWQWQIKLTLPFNIRDMKLVMGRPNLLKLQSLCRPEPWVVGWGGCGSHEKSWTHLKIGSRNVWKGDRLGLE
jgi:hypothetical protein